MSDLMCYAWVSDINQVLLNDQQQAYQIFIPGYLAFLIKISHSHMFTDTFIT